MRGIQSAVMPIEHLNQRGSERIRLASKQRQQANEFSRDVWDMLRNRRLSNAKFLREHPIGIETVDFVCLNLLRVVEIDGKDHFTTEGQRRDGLGDVFLRSEG